MKKLLLLLLIPIQMFSQNNTTYLENNPLTMDKNLYYSMGSHPSVIGVEKFGSNQSVANNTEEVIWNASSSFNWITNPKIVKVMSDDADDDNDGGTGARKICVFGLDSLYNLYNEHVAMDGTDTVQTTMKFASIYRVFVDTAGSQNTNDGTIELWDFTEDTLMAQIEEAQGQTEMSVYQIPDGYTGYLMNFEASLTRQTGAGNVACDIKFYQTNGNNVKRIVRTEGFLSQGAGRADHDFSIYPFFEERTRLEMTATPSGNSAAVTSGFSILLVKN